MRGVKAVLVLGSSVKFQFLVGILAIIDVRRIHYLDTLDSLLFLGFLRFTEVVIALDYE